MEYYQYHFEISSEEEKDILIALLSDIGFSGFEEEEKSLDAFIKIDDLNQHSFEELISGLTEIKYTRSVIKEVNWNAEWESGFKPVTVLHPGTGLAFVHLRANFHEADNNAEFDIVITPKMSFGTGHHATTYLMIEQMSKIDFKNKIVIDFGTGTAVLAILAEKLGAGKVTAIDNDEWSINNSLENIEANRCSKISLLKADSVPAGARASVILANINLNIITEHLPAITNACDPNAIILFSGIMEHDRAQIEQALVVQNIKIREILNKDGWLALSTEM